MHAHLSSQRYSILRKVDAFVFFFAGVALFRLTVGGVRTQQSKEESGEKFPDIFVGKEKSRRMLTAESAREGIKKSLL